MKKMKLSENGEDVTADTREKWGRHFEFILVSLGLSVGLGNIWRFPYLCMRNGGGAFLIPYFLFAFTCIIPLFALEFAVGQYSSQGASTVWKLSVMFKGLGGAMVALSGILSWYYNIIIAWTIYYLYRSFTSQLPWATCGHSWNTDSCYSRADQSHSNYSSGEEGSLNDTTITSNSTASDQHTLLLNTTRRMTSAEEFWQFEVLQMSEGIHVAGGIRWPLLICLAIAWLLVLICMIKGTRSIGKVVYVTATLPYILLTVLLVRGLLLTGSVDGIRYYITPRWEYLLNIKTWAEASLQVFYSLGPAWGGLVTLSSYNKFHNNCLRDAIIIPVITCLSSFFAGFVIFSIIGFMAHEANLSVEEVITSGPGLVFAAYPEALSRLPIAPFWSVLFFVMLLTVGLDSQLVSTEVVVTGITDWFPSTLKYGRPLVVSSVCIVYLLVSIPAALRAGLYYFQIIDWYVAVFSLPFVGFLESVVVAYVYGIGRLCRDLEVMIGYRPFILWKVLIAIVAPIVALGMIVTNLYTATEPSYGDYHYPRAAIAIGWLIAFSSSVPIVVMAIVAIYRAKGSLSQRIRRACEPADDWGPAASVNQSSYQAGHEFKNIALNEET